MSTPVPASESKASAHSFSQQAKPTPFFQAKLTVNQPGDAHEQEADRVADQVMRMPAFTPSAGNRVGHAPIVQQMPLTPVSHVMRACAECGNEKAQRKESSSGDASGKAAPSIVSDVLSSSGGQPMDGSTKRFMESRFGQDFSQVRIHTDSRAAESASAIQARAYTSGRDVVFGAGEYQPGTDSGKRLLAHELVHVGQQDGAVSRSLVQRDKLPCTSRRYIDVYAVNLPGATRNVDQDIKAANDTFCQCGINFNLIGGESWGTNLMDTLAPHGVLNEYSSPGNPTDEEIALLSHHPEEGAIHLYYAPSLSAGSEAEAFWHGAFPSMNEGVVVSSAARGCAFPHELGHVLLNDGAHHSNKDNLMAPGSANTCASELEQSQCDLIP